MCLSVCLSVCLTAFPHDISQTDPARSLNLTQKYSTMSPGNPFILGSLDQRSRPRDTKTLLAWVTTQLWVLVSSSFVNFYRLINLSSDRLMDQLNESIDWLISLLSSLLIDVVWLCWQQCECCDQTTCKVCIGLQWRLTNVHNSLAHVKPTISNCIRRIKQPQVKCLKSKKMVKSSHTRCRALSPELIPMTTDKQPAGDYKSSTRL